jgi:hypothetical protein
VEIAGHLCVLRRLRIRGATWVLISPYPDHPEIIDKIHALILEARRISAKSIAERVGSIIHEDLDMLVACFLPDRAKDLSAPL